MWGERASAYAERELAGERVRIVFDPESNRRGYFGRLLAYIYYSDGQNFNLQLLEQGYARLYEDSSFTLKSEFAQAEATAQAQNRGLWAFETTVTATPTPAPTPQTPADVDDGGDGGAPAVTPVDGDYDCSYFDTQDQAQ